MEKNKLTADELKALLDEVENGFKADNDLRNGQKHMIVLFDIKPELYAEITGTDDDPFYVDERMANFLKRISP